MSNQLTFSNIKIGDKRTELRAHTDFKGRCCLKNSNRNPQIAESSFYKAEFTIKSLAPFLFILWKHIKYNPPCIYQKKKDFKKINNQKLTATINYNSCVPEYFKT